MYRPIVPLLLVLLLLSGCGGTQNTGGQQEASDREENSIEFFAMDTYMSIRAYGADGALLERAAAGVTELENRVSTTLEGSEINRLNREGRAALSQDTAFLLRRALELCDRTGGALDITVYPIVRAWGFTTEEYRVPEAEEIAALLERVDYRRIELSEDGTRAALPEGVELDLGSVTKGYVGDMLAGLLREEGVTSALMDLGGNVQAVGSKPDGGDWRIGIQDPEGEGMLGVLSIADKAVITSGGYERYFIDEDGNLWWHIMDPSTGRPAQNGLISVTIVGEEGLTCDALSTALFILGPERAVSYWREHRDFEMALVTEDGELLLTPELAGQFTASSHLAYEVKVIPEA